MTPLLIAAAMLTAAWQSLVLGALSWSTCWLVPRLSFATRTTLWNATALVCPLLFFLQFADQRALQTTGLAAVSRATVSLPDTTESTAMTAVTAAPRVGRKARVAVDEGLVIAGLTAMAMLSALLLVRLVRGVSAVRGLKMRSVPVSYERCELLNDVIRHDFILARRRPTLRASDDIDAPAALGYFAPMIVFPTGQLEGLKVRTFTHALLHELAHLRRFDDWTFPLCELLRALFPFLPGVHWAAHRLRLERELACDEWVVVHAGVLPRHYASSLARLGELAMARSRDGSALVHFANTQLGARVALLLADRGRGPSPRLQPVALLLPCIACAALWTLGPSVALSAPVAIGRHVITATPRPRATSPHTSVALPRMQVGVGASNVATPAAAVPHDSDAIELTAEIATDASVNALIGALTSQSAAERAAAAFALGQMRAAALGAVPALTRMLTDEREVARRPQVTSAAWNATESRVLTSPAEEAAKALLYVGRPALAEVERAAEDPSLGALPRMALVLRLLRQFD